MKEGGGGKEMKRKDNFTIYDKLDVAEEKGSTAQADEVSFNRKFKFTKGKSLRSLIQQCKVWLNKLWDTAKVSQNGGTGVCLSIWEGLCKLARKMNDRLEIRTWKRHEVSWGDTLQQQLELRI